jgi:ATP-binding cassette subfamily F protein uup
MQQEMERHATEYGRLSELAREQERITAELDAAMARWVELSALVEAIEAEKANRR